MNLEVVVEQVVAGEGECVKRRHFFVNGGNRGLFEYRGEGHLGRERLIMWWRKRMTVGEMAGVWMGWNQADKWRD